MCGHGIQKLCTKRRYERKRLSARDDNKISIFYTIFFLLNFFSTSSLHFTILCTLRVAECAHFFWPGITMVLSSSGASFGTKIMANECEITCVRDVSQGKFIAAVPQQTVEKDHRKSERKINLWVRMKEATLGLIAGDEWMRGEFELREMDSSSAERERKMKNLLHCCDLFDLVERRWCWGGKGGKI